MTKKKKKYVAYYRPRILEIIKSGDKDTFRQLKLLIPKKKFWPYMHHNIFIQAYRKQKNIDERMLSVLKIKRSSCMYYRTECPIDKEPKKKKMRQRRKKRKGTPAQRRSKYNTYLHSDAWKQKRQEAFTHHGKHCELCNATTYLQVHHLTYEHIYNELMEDLMVLCRTCHKKVHNIK